MPSDTEQPRYPLYLYAFRYRDPLTGNWRKARYRAELHEIRERYAEFEIDGEPIGIDAPSTGTFSPFKTGGN